MSYKWKDVPKECQCINCYAGEEVCLFCSYVTKTAPFDVEPLLDADKVPAWVKEIWAKNTKPTVPAENFMATIAANVDNKKLSNAEFRQFIRNTLPVVEYPRPEEKTMKSS